MNFSNKQEYWNNKTDHSSTHLYDSVELLLHFWKGPTLAGSHFLCSHMANFLCLPLPPVQVKRSQESPGMWNNHICRSRHKSLSSQAASSQAEHPLRAPCSSHHLRIPGICLTSWLQFVQDPVPHWQFLWQVRDVLSFQSDDVFI